MSDFDDDPNADFDNDAFVASDYSDFETSSGPPVGLRVDLESESDGESTSQDGEEGGNRAAAAAAAAGGDGDGGIRILPITRMQSPRGESPDSTDSFDPYAPSSPSAASALASSRASPAPGGSFPSTPAAARQPTTPNPATLPTAIANALAPISTAIAQPSNTNSPISPSLYSKPTPSSRRARAEAAAARRAEAERIRQAAADKRQAELEAEAAAVAEEAAKKLPPTSFRPKAASILMASLQAPQSDHDMMVKRLQLLSNTAVSLDAFTLGAMSQLRNELLESDQQQQQQQQPHRRRNNLSIQPSPTLTPALSPSGSNSTIMNFAPSMTNATPSPTAATVNANKKRMMSSRASPTPVAIPSLAELDAKVAKRNAARLALSSPSSPTSPIPTFAVGSSDPSSLTLSSPSPASVDRRSAAASPSLTGASSAQVKELMALNHALGAELQQQVLVETDPAAASKQEKDRDRDRERREREKYLLLTPRRIQRRSVVGGGTTTGEHTPAAQRSTPTTPKRHSVSSSPIGTHTPTNLHATPAPPALSSAPTATTPTFRIPLKSPSSTPIVTPHTDAPLPTSPPVDSSVPVVVAVADKKKKPKKSKSTKGSTVSSPIVGPMKERVATANNSTAGTPTLGSPTLSSRVSRNPSIRVQSTDVAYSPDAAMSSIASSLEAAVALASASDSPPSFRHSRAVDRYGSGVVDDMSPVLGPRHLTTAHAHHVTHAAHAPTPPNNANTQPPPLSNKDTSIVERLVQPIHRRPLKVQPNVYIPIKADLAEWEQDDVHQLLQPAPQTIQSLQTFSFSSTMTDGMSMPDESVGVWSSASPRTSLPGGVTLSVLKAAHPHGAAHANHGTPHVVVLEQVMQVTPTSPDDGDEEEEEEEDEEEEAEEDHPTEYIPSDDPDTHPHTDQSHLSSQLVSPSLSPTLEPASSATLPPPVTTAAAPETETETHTDAVTSTPTQTHQPERHAPNEDITTMTTTSTNVVQEEIPKHEILEQTRELAGEEQVSSTDSLEQDDEDNDDDNSAANAAGVNGAAPPSSHSTASPSPSTSPIPVLPPDSVGLSVPQSIVASLSDLVSATPPSIEDEAKRPIGLSIDFAFEQIPEQFMRESSGEIDTGVSDRLTHAPVGEGVSYDLLDEDEDDPIAAIALNAPNASTGTYDVDDVTSEIIRDLASVQLSGGGVVGSPVSSPSIESLLADSRAFASSPSPVPTTIRITVPPSPPPEMMRPKVNEEHEQAMREIQELEKQLVMDTSAPLSAIEPNHTSNEDTPPLDPSVASDAAAALDLARSASYTGLLRVVQLRGDAGIATKLNGSKAHVRRVMAHGIEQAKMEELTERWIQNHSCEHVDDVDEKSSSSFSPSPFKPSRTRPTIGPSTISDSPSAPKLTGTSLIPSSKHDLLSTHRSSQLEREEHAKLRISSKRFEPYFQIPSSSSPIRTSILLKRINPLKQPLTPNVASSTCAFYVAPHQPPLRVEFQTPPDPYPRAMDMATNQFKTNNRRANKYPTTNASMTAATTMQATHMAKAYSGSQSARGYSDPPPAAPVPLSGAYWDDPVPESAHTFYPSSSLFDRSRFGVDGFVSVPSSPLHSRPQPSQSPPHAHISLPTSPRVTRRHHHVPHINANTAIPSQQSTQLPPMQQPGLPNVSNLAAALLVHSTAGVDMAYVRKPLFPSYHSYKSTLLKKKSTITPEVESHAHAHAHAGSASGAAAHTARPRQRPASPNEQVVLLIDQGKRRHK